MWNAGSPDVQVCSLSDMDSPSILLCDWKRAKLVLIFHTPDHHRCCTEYVHGAKSVSCLAFPRSTSHSSHCYSNCLWEEVTWQHLPCAAASPSMFDNAERHLQEPAQTHTSITWMCKSVNAPGGSPGPRGGESWRVNAPPPPVLSLPAH